MSTWEDPNVLFFDARKKDKQRPLSGTAVCLQAPASFWSHTVVAAGAAAGCMIACCVAAYGVPL